jgi:tRNA (mo5U34)-methyltransferase
LPSALAPQSPARANAERISVPDRPLAQAVAEHTWYHTIELPGGIRTPGLFENDTILRRLPLPASLEGKRCLDVGTCDGFYAFEMERRGAASVTAIDLDDHSRRDWPAQAPREIRSGVADARKPSFELAREALGSKAERIDCSVYDLRPDDMGTFDFAFLGSLLLHLRDPVGALIALRSVVRGQLLVTDVVSLALWGFPWPMARLVAERNPYWWIPNVAAFRRYVEAAGFTIVESGGPVFVQYGRTRPRLPPWPPRWRTLPWFLFQRPLGVPHAWALAR